MKKPALLSLLLAYGGLYHAIYNPCREFLGFVNHFNRQAEGLQLRF